MHPCPHGSSPGAGPGGKVRWPRLLVVLAVPSAAWANAGIPVGGDSLAMSIQWFLGVAALEYLILRPDLASGRLRSLWGIAAANILSTAAGAVIELATLLVPATMNPSLGSRSSRADVVTWILFVPLFFLSWWIEGTFFIRRLREISRPAVQRCLFRADLASCAMLALFVGIRACLRHG